MCCVSHVAGSKVFEGKFQVGSVSGEKRKTSEHPLAESATACSNVLNAQMKDLMRLNGDFQDCLDWQPCLMADKPGTKLLCWPSRGQSIKKISVMRTDVAYGDKETDYCADSVVCRSPLISCKLPGCHKRSQGEERNTRKQSLPLSAAEMWGCRNLAKHSTRPK